MTNQHVSLKKVLPKAGGPAAKKRRVDGEAGEVPYLVESKKQ